MSLEPFAQMVLDQMEPDPLLQEQWLAEDGLLPVSQSPAMRAFAQRIRQAIEKKEKVFVAGDFDADGILATAILVDGLKSLGLQTGYYIPDRIREGYGLAARTVTMAYEKGYSLIITVDNGVKAREALAQARKLGMDVIVSDHHQYDHEPDAGIFLHPQVLEDGFFSLCGAALAFEMLRALGLESDKHLIWAAVASIADCMQVSGQTRRIIRSGIRALQEQGQVHVRTLAGRRIQSETDLSFQVVPKINAIGRLSNMANVNTAVRFFLCENPAQISEYAQKVEKLNEYRKNLTNSQNLIAVSALSLYRPILLCADERFHEGIVGILAGKICGAYKKPAIVASIRNGICRASMRAPRGFDILEFMKDYPDFEAFGGHQEAAGFSIRLDRWKEFEAYCLKRMKTYRWTPQKRTRMVIDPGQITLDNIRSLDALRPFGPGFECPDFVLEKPEIAHTFELAGGKHRKFTLKNGIQCLNFNQSPNDIQRSRDPIESLIGSLQLSEFRGRVSPSFIVEDIVYS